MASDGSVNIDSKIDGSGFSSGLSKISGAAKTALGALTGAVGVGIAGVAAIGKASLSAYSNYEQLVGGVETLFKSSASIVEGYAANAYKTAGLSANDYMETVTGFSASLLQSVGGNTAKAANAANSALTDMSDNANKMGTSMGSIQYAYQGFAKQNYTMLDNLKLGYGGTKEEMARLLSDAQKLTGVKYDISNLNDVYSAIHVIQTNLGITGTTAKEASTTLQGSASAMKASWENLLTGMADPTQNFDQLLQNLLDSVGVFGANLLPRITIILSGVATLIDKLGPIIAAELPKLAADILPKLSAAAVSIVQSLVQGLSENASQLASAASQIIGTLANGITQLLPQILDLAVTLILTLADGLTQHADQIVTGGSALIEKLVTTLLQAAPKLATAAVQLMSGFFTTLMKQNPPAGIFLGVIGAVKGLQGAFSGLNAVASTVNKFQNAGGLLSKLEGPFKQAAGNFDTIRIGAMLAGDKFKAFGGKVAELAKGAGGLVGSLAKGAAGFAKMGAQAVASAAKLVIQKGAMLASAAAGKIAAAAQWLLNAAMNANPIALVVIAIAALVAAFILLWNNCAGFRNFWIGLWAGIQSVAQTVGTAIAGFFTAAWAGIQAVWGAAAGWFGNIWSGIQNVFSAVGSWFASVFGAAWNGIKSVWSAATGWFQGVWNGITKVFSVVGGWFGSHFRDAWNAITGVFKGIGGWFGDKFKEAKKAILNIFKPNMLTDAGKKLINGLWDGIKNMGNWLKDKISGFGKSVVDGFKGVFGIHSPSAVFRDEIGKMIPPGIAIGFEKSTPAAIKNMQSEMAGMVSRMQASVASQQSMAGRYAVPPRITAQAPEKTPAPAYAGPTTVEAHIYFNGREAAVALTPAIAKQMGWKGGK